MLDGSFEPPPWPEPKPIPLTAKQQARLDERAQARAERLQARAEQALQRQHLKRLKAERRWGAISQDMAVEERLDTERAAQARKAVYYTMGNVYFEQFVERRMAPELRDGAAVPATWVGTKVDWNSLRQQAEDVARERLAAEFAEGIALRGLTPEEIASGTLNDGSEIGKVAQG